jgi:hypothetical protein
MLTTTTFPRRTVVAFAVVAAAFALAVAGLFSSGADATSSGASFSVLATPAAVAPPGVFPPRVLRAGADPKTDAHLALDRAGLRFYVVAPNSDLVCLAVRTASATATTCRSRIAITPDTAIWISHAQPGGAFDLYGLVPDGVEAALLGGSTANVTNNVFLLQDVPAVEHHLKLTGPTVDTSIAIGEQVPPGQVIAPDPGP